MRIWMDPDKLNNYGLTTNDVVKAIRRRMPQVSAGSIGGSPAAPGQSSMPRSSRKAGCSTPEQFRGILLRVNPDGSQVSLGDVARVELGAETYTTIARYNGRPAAGIGIRLAAGANALDTATACGRAWTELQPFFPPASKVVYPIDTTPFVQALDRGES